MGFGADFFHRLIQIGLCAPNPERDVANGHSARDTDGPFVQHALPTWARVTCTSFPLFAAAAKHPFILF